MLQGFASGNGAGTVPQGDAAGHDALNGASVEVLVFLSFNRKSCCWAFFGQWCVDAPAQVSEEVYTQELGAASINRGLSPR